MENTKSLKNVGLTSWQLQNVFPYHIVVNNNFQIVQIGKKLMDILNFKTVDGIHISKVFDVESPSFKKWEWSEIMLSKQITFNVTLKPKFLSKLKRADIKELCLKGDMLLQQQNESFSNATQQQEIGAIFLFHLNIHNTDELREKGFTVHDIPNYSLQREYMSNRK